MLIRILRMFLCSGAVGIIGCASGYDDDTYARYDDNGVIETHQAEWFYGERRQQFEVQSFRWSHDPWQYPAWRHSEAFPRRDLAPARPDTSYRRKERSEVRNRDQQQDSAPPNRPSSRDVNPRGPQNDRKDKRLDRPDPSEEIPRRKPAPESSERVRRR